MASSIDATKPVQGSATTLSVRNNFSAAKTEIEALQTDKADLASPALTGTATAVNLTVSGTLNAAGTLQVGGSAVTSTAAELNILDGVTASAAEINYLDIATLGTAQASKAVTVSAGSVIDFNNIDMTNVDINSGAIDGTVIGAAAAAAATFAGLNGSTTVNNSASGTIALDATNGVIQWYKAVGTITFTDSLNNGDFLFVVVEADTTPSRTVNWPANTWSTYGSPGGPFEQSPSLAGAAGTTVVWKANNVLLTAYFGVVQP